MLTHGGDSKNTIPIRDALEVLEGKWKLPILFSLASGTKRFKEIKKEVAGISDKTLSKDLRSLEDNQLLTRVVYSTFPPIVEYTITAHGMSLEKLLDELHIWGLTHRRQIIGK